MDMTLFESGEFPHDQYPDLPFNFSYLIKGRLAGSSTPAWRGEPMSALAALRDAGIQAILSLDEEGLPAALAREFGFDYLHSPIADFRAPSLEQVDECLSFLHDAIEAGKPAAAHCHAGLGRTGTILACYLIRFEGASAAEAIERTRHMRPGSIETREQELLIEQYVEHTKHAR